MIAGNLDDILDYMESVAHNLVLFELARVAGAAAAVRATSWAPWSSRSTP